MCRRGMVRVSPVVPSPTHVLFPPDARFSASVFCHLLVLEVGKFDEHFGGGVVNLEELQNRRPVVCDRHVSDGVHEHLLF